MYLYQVPPARRIDCIHHDASRQTVLQLWAQILRTGILKVHSHRITLISGMFH